ncbi:MAG TPA: histone deacetylase [Anaerolineae bacterium]|nr:histone deacetylase [Anaerolineae bacterium]
MTLPLVYHPDYVTPLPPEHRFPMPKFGKVYDLLLREALAAPQVFHRPEIASPELLALVHTPAYIDAFCSGTLEVKAQRRIGLPWSPNLVKRTRTAVGGTVLTAQLALQHGLACNVAGGTHHAFPDFGSGFCIFNDLAVATRCMQARGLAERVMIIDLDVHQGDGSALIFQQDPSVFTFSVHCEKNFPFRKQHSDFDMALPEGVDDNLFLRRLAETLPDLLAEVRPDLVLYDAGVDPHQQDRLGKLALTSEGLYRRDKYVLETCLRQGYPVATVIGGGYDQDVERLSYRHLLVFRAALELYADI